MKKAVVIDGRLNNLPFRDALSWEDFQTFCTDLLYQQPNSFYSREYLSLGSNQQGIDIYVVPIDGEKITVAQCKLVEYLGPQQVLDIIDDFLKGNLVEGTKEFILCTSADLGRQRDEEETIRKAKEKLSIHGIDFIPWDARELSTKLRNEGDDNFIKIVCRYFNNEIAENFYEPNVWKRYIQKYSLVEKKVIDLPQDYIERKVVSYKDSIEDKGKEKSNYWGYGKKLTMIDLLEKSNKKEDKKIVLLSTAGFGKSEELAYLNAYFSTKDKLLHPIKFSLRDYEGQSIEIILSSYSVHWRNISQENLLLLLDGIDEIGEKKASVFINYLNAFVEQNSEIRAVVSSRYNFYDVQHPQLRSFEIFLLEPLNHNDIQNYLDKKLPGIKADFEQVLEERHFSEYLTNPYYLTRLVRFYKGDLSLFPKNKTALFERILFEQLDADEGKYNIKELKSKLLPCAKQIAFCMTVSGKSNLTDKEVDELIPDSEVRRLLNHFCILNRNASTLGSWSFEHKNLQEYLCASVFQSLSFEDVKSIVSFKFDNNKLLPGFLNTISFLFELADKADENFHKLFDWINANEPELLVRFEKEQILKETRNEIFKKIIQYYQDKSITLRISSNFSDRELAYFIELEDSAIDIISAQIRQGLIPNLVYDLLYILSYTQRAYRFEGKITDLLFYILNCNSYPEFVQAKAIRNFAELNFNEKEFFEKILSCKIHLSNYEIRSACIYFLDCLEYQDDYVKFILESIEIFEKHAKKSNSSSSSFTLKHLILKFEKPQAIKSLFQYCIGNKNCIDRHSQYREFHFELDDLKILLGRAKEIYKIDSSIVRIIYRLFCKQEYLSQDNNWLHPYWLFFEQTCGSKKLFYTFYKHDKKGRDLMSFADEECCDFLVTEYKAGKILESEMLAFKNVLSWVNWSLYKFFHEKIKSLGNGIFLTVDIEVDYGVIRKLQLEKNQLMLLNKKLFLEEAEQIFNLIAKENVSQNDFWFSENVELQKFESSVAKDAIRDMCIHDDDKEISKEEFFEKYNDEKEWKGFVIDTIKGLFENKKEEVINPELIGIIEKWCKDKIVELKFENSILDNGDSFNFITIVEFVKDVFVLLDMDLEDELLLKMLPSLYECFYEMNDDKKTIGSLILDKIEDKELLKSTIVNNVRNGKLPFVVLLSHFALCHKQGYKECLPKLYQTITSANPHLKDHDRVKLSDFYLDLGGSIEDFSSYLAVPESEDKNSIYYSWHWYLIEKLIKVKPERITQLLLEIMKDPNQFYNKEKAAQHLIELNRIEGLIYCGEHVEEHKKMPFEQKWASFQANIKEMPLNETLEILFSLLQVCIRYNVKERFGRMDESVYGSLITISQPNFSLYNTIKERVGNLILSEKDDSWIDSLKYFSERLTQRYFENQVQEVDVNEANLIYQSKVLKMN